MKPERAWAALVSWLGRQRIFPPAERVGRLAFVGAAGLLVFACGFWSAYSQTFPYRIVEDAIKAAYLVAGLEEDWHEDYPGFVYYDLTERREFANRHTRGRAGEGVTVLNYFHDENLYLLNNDGQVLHRYRPKFTKEERAFYFGRIRERTSYFDEGRHIYAQDIHIFPNGDAILMLNVAGKIWPFGVGFAKIDRDSNVLWKTVELHTHHEFEVGADGRIFGLSSRRRQQPLKDLRKVPVPFMENYVVVLNPDGEVIDRISLMQAIMRSSYLFYLERNGILPLKPSETNNDYLHANDIDVISAEQAEVFPYAEEGDLLISMRDIHAIGVLDVEERRFKWMRRGPWILQHDPDILPNGNILVYDNMGADGKAGRSRILEYNPHTERVVWSYAGTPEDPFESEVRGSQQQLPNGNVLISETTRGRIFEITRSGEIVWQFVSPFRFGERKQYVPAVRWPRRIPLDYFAPEFRRHLEAAAKTARPLGDPETEHAAK